MAEHGDCLYEDRIQGLSRKTAELETRADYKDKRIDELNEGIKEVKRSMDSLEKTITEFILKSINDDSALRELVNSQDNRITALETTNKTLKWAIGLGFSVLTILITLLGFLVAHLH